MKVIIINIITILVKENTTSINRAPLEIIHLFVFVVYKEKFLKKKESNITIIVKEQKL